MKLTLRGSVYVADLRKLGGERVSLKTSDLEEAKRRYIAAVGDIGTVTKVGKVRSDVTIGMGLLEAHRGGDWGSAKDKRSIGTRWKKVSAFFPEDTPLSAITRSRMTEFIGWMRDHKDKQGKPRYAPKTINRHLAFISKLLRDAAEAEVIPGMPLVPWLKVPKGGRIRWYVQEEEVRMLAWFRDNEMPEMASLAEFLLDSGFRRGEAIGPYRVVEGCAVLDDQKNGRQTKTPLTPRALAAALEKSWAGMSASQLNNRWVKMRTALNLGPAANLHACRHTTATRLAIAGVKQSQIQKFMRHETESVTAMYVHLADDGLKDALAALQSGAGSVPKTSANLVQIVAQAE